MRVKCSRLVQAFQSVESKSNWNYSLLEINMPHSILTVLNFLFETIVVSLIPSLKKVIVSQPRTISTTTNISTRKSISTPTEFKKIKIVKAKELTEEEIANLLAENFQILTGPNAEIPITDAQSKLIVLLTCQHVSFLLIAKSHQASHEVSTVKSLLRRLGNEWDHLYLVEPNVIKTIYEGQPEAKTHTDNTKDFLPNLHTEPVETVAMERLFVQILDAANRVNASDIHVFVRRTGSKVFYRVNGGLRMSKEISEQEGSALCQAVFAMSDTSDPTYNANEQQSARVNGQTLKSIKFKGAVESLRLQFNPLADGGRHLVVRILYSLTSKNRTSFDQLGYYELQFEQMKRMRQRPTGMIIISGPTGSGKSTTLTNGLNALMNERPGTSTLTIEDPPEYIIEGAAQIPVTNAKTYDERTEKFNIAIAGALRSDPDTIMIGEIRDRSSAKLAFEAAMTGHSVWTTLHANSAIGIYDRLLDLEVESYKLTDISNISGLISQQLIETIIPENSISFKDGVKQKLIDTEFASQIREFDGNLAQNVRFTSTNEQAKNLPKFYRSVIAETIVPDQGFLDILKRGDRVEAKTYWLEQLEGITMYEHALIRMFCGEIDPRTFKNKFGEITLLSEKRKKVICEQLKTN